MANSTHPLGYRLALAGGRRGHCGAWERRAGAARPRRCRERGPAGNRRRPGAPRHLRGWSPSASYPAFTSTAGAARLGTSLMVGCGALTLEGCLPRGRPRHDHAPARHDDRDHQPAFVRLPPAGQRQGCDARITRRCCLPSCWWTRLSAFLINDAICLSALDRNPVLYLVAVAMASNVGSTTTITGNPQNMITRSL